MSTIGPYNDAPYKIVNEGRQITISLTKLNDEQIKISWTLPSNPAGCSLPPEAYNGIVIVLDTIAIGVPQTPVNGNHYVADPTADVNLHAGDKLGSGLVVGAFYNDKTTNSLIISGIQPSTAYYVGGFAVDNVFNHHSEGVFTYSQLLKKADTGSDTKGYQIIRLGVQGSDLTGLVAPNTYNMSIMVDDTKYNWTFAGADVTTFTNLVDAIQNKFNTINSPYVGPIAPNTGGLYFNESVPQISQWTGSAYSPYPLVVSSSDPAAPFLNSYWVDANNVLHQWNGVNWQAVTVASYTHPYNQLICDDHWFNGTTAYVWDNTVWKSLPTVITASVDPAAAPTMLCHTYWYDETNNKLFSWDALTNCDQSVPTSGKWTQVNAMLSATDPTNTPIFGTFWFNDVTNVLKIWNGAWVAAGDPVVIQNIAPNAPVVNVLWFNAATDELKQWNGTVWVTRSVLVWGHAPNVPVSGDIWWNTTNDVLSVWDVITSNWKVVTTFIMSVTDPALPPVLPTNFAWYNSTTSVLQTWDGTRWNACSFINSPTVPTVGINDYFYNTVTHTFSQWNGTTWGTITALSSPVNPVALLPGTFWYNPTTHGVQLWNGIAWVSTIYSTTPINPAADSLWLDTTTNTLKQWSNNQWNVIEAKADIVLDPTTGNITITSNTIGSRSRIIVPEFLDQPVGATPNVDPNLFNVTNPHGLIQPSMKGTDSISGVPLYNQLGVGTDGSSDERRNLVDRMLLSLGHPSVEVELTKEQLEFCVDSALSTFRKYSASAYERAFFFMDLQPGTQNYYLTDKTVGMNRIVRISAINRKSSSFMSNAQNSGVWGQMVLQQMYQMGTYDLVSYSMMSDYIELMEILFATRVMFQFNERSRRLDIFQNCNYLERVLVDASVERTEQDLMTDRLISKWILNWATGEACSILSNIRGKFSTLPGAGGSVSLNAADMKAQSDALFEKCMKEIDDFIVSEIEEFGLNCSIVIG